MKSNVMLQMTLISLFFLGAVLFTALTSPVRKASASEGLLVLPEITIVGEHTSEPQQVSHIQCPGHVVYHVGAGNPRCN